MGLAPTGKRRLFTAHAESSHSGATDLTAEFDPKPSLVPTADYAEFLLTGAYLTWNRSTEALALLLRSRQIISADLSEAEPSCRVESAGGDSY